MITFIIDDLSQCLIEANTGDVVETEVLRVTRKIFTDPSSLDILDYPEADINWLHCVVGHRRNRFFSEVVLRMKSYDVISGKNANDNTNITITAYLDGIYGEVGSARADDICISLLLPERLKDQFCFRTENALKCLRFERSEQIWL